MKKKTRYIISILILLGLAVLLVIGFKTPPERLRSTDISMINAVSLKNQENVKLTKDEISYWNTLDFDIVISEYPGESPDFVINLIGEKNEFTAMYNMGDDIIFFSFIPEIKYGFLNSPPPGGWTRPLYKTEVTNELLKLLKIENALQQKI